ncbi:MAG: ABC transporter permease [Planctomycetota bacterium]|jgi:ABC-2 type transport system permease protein|nr:ABC transporter permease [Planctomycetota bacterium]
MRPFAVLLRREVHAYAVSPLTYLVLTLFWLMQGFLFFLYVETSRGDYSTIVRATFSSNFFFILITLAPPLLTMRLFAEEKRRGTLEVLLTAPVTNLQVVLSKFFASWILFGGLWLPVALHFLVLSSYGSAPHWGPIGTGILGTLLVGSFYCSIGLFASVISDEQMISAVVSVVLCLSLLFLHFLHFLGPPADIIPYLRHTSIPFHFHDLAKGILDTRALTFFLSGTLFFLFVSWKMLQTRQWRSP